MARPLSPGAPVSAMRWARIGKPVVRLAVCLAVVVAVSAPLSVVPVSVRVLSAVLSFLFVVLIVAAFWGFRYAVFVSFIAALAFTLLVPPVGRFQIDNIRDVIALIAFLVIGITTSHFSDRARRGEKELRELIETIPAMVWSALPDGSNAFANRRWTEYTGLSAEQTSGSGWQSMVHPEDLGRHMEKWRRSLATGQPFENEMRYRRTADGQYRWFLVQAVPLRDETGNIFKWYGTSFDIEDLKRIEEALRSSEAYLTEAQRLTHTGSWAWSPGPGDITYWSEECYRVLGFDPAGSLPRFETFFQRIHPDDQRATGERFEKAIREKSAFEMEYRIVHPDGDTRDIHVVGHPMLGPSSDLVEFVGTVIDVTERKRAEEALRRSEAYLAEAQRLSKTGSWALKPGMAKPAYWSDEMFRIWGFDPQQGLPDSETAWQRIHPDDLKTIVQEKIERASSGKEKADVEHDHRIVLPDGALKYIHGTSHPVFDEAGNVVEYVGASVDVTERKRAEEALRRSEKELREIIETIPAMAWSAQPDGTNAFANRQWAEYTGLSVEQTSGAGWQSTVHPEDLGRHMESWCRCLPTGQPFEHETRLRRAADGRYRWFLIRALPMRDEHGTILHWYGTLVDIDDRKRAEALLAGEKRILEMVAKGDSLAQILDSLCRLVEEQASGVLASILLIDGDRLRHGGAPSLPKAYTQAIDGVLIGPAVGSCGTAAYSRSQVIVEDIATDPLWADYRAAALPHSLRACWSTPVFSSQGKVIATFAMYYREPRSPSPRDQEIIEQITDLAGVAIERKLTQEALRRSEAYLAEAQKLSKTGSWAFRPGTAKPFYWSEEMFRIWGFDPQQGLPDYQTAWQRIHPDDLKGTFPEHMGTAFTGDLKVDVVSEFRIVLPDGTVKHLHATSQPVFDDTGKVVEYFGTSVDVTERKRAEEELRAAETRFRASVDHLTEAVFIHNDQDDQGRVVDVNQQACDSLGYTREELIGMTAFDYDALVDAAFMRSIKDRVARGEIFSFESVHRRKDRTVFPVEVRVRPFWHGDHQFGLTVVRDITERKRAEAERERLRQLEGELARMDRVSTVGELTASLAHEINQPIGAAVTNAQACLRLLDRDQPDVAEAREAVFEMVKDARRAAAIIDRVRSMCRKGSSQLEVVNVNEVVEEMVLMLHNEANRHSIRIRTELAKGVPRVMADHVQLQQVLMNLMLNGIEAMQGTTGELGIKSQLAEDGQLLISVTDTGVGLPTANLDRIFDAFFTTKSQGTGLGLAITRSIVESHGGRVWATPNSGKGASFHFTLPSRVAQSA